MLLNLLKNNSNENFLLSRFFKRLWKFLLQKIKDFFFILINFFYIFKLIKYKLKSQKIFLIANPAIGHYPIDLYLASKIYGEKSIFVFKSGLNFANKYLVKKIYENYNVKNNYEILTSLQESVERLTMSLVSFEKCPGILHPTEKHNYAKYLDGESKIFDFNESENNEGLTFLKKHNIEKEKFICFIIRTSEYYDSMNKSSREENYSYRNVNQENYVQVLKYLINKGYKIIRMGKGTKSKFPFEHKNFIDYSLSKDRSDFLDIWLSANCKFFLHSGTGIGVIPLLFNVPIVSTEQMTPLRTLSWLPKSIHLPRPIKNRNNKMLNVKEIIEYGLHWKVVQSEYDKLKIRPIENEPEEILNAVIEMENQIEKGFIISNMNMEFWHKTKKVWENYTFKNKKNNKPYEYADRFTFAHWHKINGIKTIIPDFYLKKYADTYLNYDENN